MIVVESARVARISRALDGLLWVRSRARGGARVQRSYLLALASIVAALSILLPSPPASASIVLPINFDPNPVKPGHKVVGIVKVPAGAASGNECGLQWDGDPLTTRCKDLRNGQAQASFTVPEDASPSSTLLGVSLPLIRLFA
jgi:hypothetical protein